MAFGLKLRKFPKDEIKRRVDEAARILDIGMMAGILLYAFAGALLGGFAVGIIENLAGAYLVGTELKLTVALVIIVSVLVVKPSGLLGRTVLSRV